MRCVVFGGRGVQSRARVWRELICAVREAGLLTSEELAGQRQSTPYLSENDRLTNERLNVLSKAAAKFLALREANGGKSWQEWTTEQLDGIDRARLRAINRLYGRCNSK